ncbi:MAG: hypothetical protein KGY80_05505 [Candidatus Thorarchaeota archaeon]|nr:hypothetical protein [Candidatus Thorarchaeota archaeon]
MAHEGLSITLVVLGLFLLIIYYFGPRTEVREVKRQEGFIMLIPSAIILFIIAVIVFSGIIG